MGTYPFYLGLGLAIYILTMLAEDYAKRKFYIMLPAKKTWKGISLSVNVAKVWYTTLIAIEFTRYIIQIFNLIAYS